MYNISLKNGKTFLCDSSTTILEAAKNNGIILDHSCLTARCRSCVVQIVEGTIKEKLNDLVLSSEEKSNKWILSCNSIPTSDVELDIEDLGDIKIFEKKIIPAKIETINRLNDTVIEVCLRLPPNPNFRYNSGQYVNITKGSIKRSYSIANAHREYGLLTFLIRKYENGQMSKYWFEQAKKNDLLRIEGPVGSFFLRESDVKNIIFIATGTGVAPIKAILESISESERKFSNKNIWVFIGARHENDIFWQPNEFNGILILKYIPVLSKPTEHWIGEKGYVQDIVLKQNIPLSDSQVYACGSNNMIESAKKLFLVNGLCHKNFFSDAFVATN